MAQTAQIYSAPSGTNNQTYTFAELARQQQDVIVLQQEHARAAEVTVLAPVYKMLPDDTEGLQHERFLLGLTNGTTILLAQDNYRTARKVITSPDIVIKVAPKKVFATRWDTLKNLENPPTPADYIVMEEITQLADGSSTPAKIFKQLDTIPTHRLWHCCATMLLQELVTVELPQTTTILGA